MTKIKKFFTSRKFRKNVYHRDRYIGYNTRLGRMIIIATLILCDIFIWTVNIKVAPNINEAFASTTISWENPRHVHVSVTQSTPEKDSGRDQDLSVKSPEVKTSGAIDNKIRAVFPEEPETMLAIAKAESKLNPNAKHVNTNGTVDTGIFQINSIHGYAEEWLTNADNNLAVARKIYDTQGKQAWVAYKNGAYNNWLK